MPHRTHRARLWPMLHLVCLLTLFLSLGVRGQGASAQRVLGPGGADSEGRSGEPISAPAPSEGPAAERAAPLSYPPDLTADIA
ncbi:MAG: hypothetical protein JXA74_15920 [Anaerolineae bacterium]|nr:hypothetical protein [Anaerolineae bacterium]